MPMLHVENESGLTVATTADGADSAELQQLWSAFSSRVASLAASTIAAEQMQATPGTIPEETMTTAKTTAVTLLIYRVNTLITSYSVPHF